jgi:ribosomal protein S18 acetylase RimI-like enzyme
MESSVLHERVATERDIESLVHCDAYAQGHASRRHELARWVAERSCFIGELQGQVVGFVVVQHNFFGNGFIPLVCVAAAHRGNGQGLRLLFIAECRCQAEKLFVSANASNLPARRLFERAGFVSSGRIENLDEGDTELVYFKPKGQRRA